MRVLTLDEVGYVSGAESEMGGGDGGIGNQYDGPGADSSANSNNMDAFNFWQASVWCSRTFSLGYYNSNAPTVRGRLIDGAINGAGGFIMGGIG